MTQDPEPGPRGKRPYADFRTAALGSIPSGRARQWLAAMIVIAVVGGVGLCAGFFAFLTHISRYETEFGRSTDGVVALTGGPERISDALSVLAEGRARRLLITGVGEKTVMADLVRQSGHAKLFECCVDLDRLALNTVGNAAETARWARKNGYTSLLIVTSNFHMPRALLELRRRLKNTEFVPHPVMAESVRIETWWSDLRLARLLVIEYLKFIVAEARSRLVPDNP